MTSPDPVAAALDMLPAVDGFAYPGEWEAAGPLLRAALDKVLARHSCEPWYAGADDCGHPEPEDDMSDEWQDWDDEHVTAGGILVCKLTVVDRFCPECTALKFGEEPPVEDGEFVSAPCATRSDILSGLTGEAGGSLWRS